MSDPHAGARPPEDVPGSDEPPDDEGQSDDGGDSDVHPDPARS
jgi:hypothetical protein